MASIAKLAIQIVTDTTRMSAGLAAAQGQLLSLGQKAAGAAGAITPLAAGFTAAAAALGAFTALGVRAAAQLEQTKIAFEVMSGSAAKGAELLNDLRGLSAESPLNFDDVQRAAKTLLAMGENIGLVVSEIEMLGNISSGTGQPLVELAQVFGQVMQAGRLTGNELRQFNERGVPLLTELAKQMGVTKRAIRGMVEAGQISSADVVKAFESMTGAGGRFANLMERQTDTLSGQWEKFKENVTIIAAQLAGPLAEALKQVLMLVNQLLDGIIKLFGLERKRRADAAQQVKLIRDQQQAEQQRQQAAEKELALQKSIMEEGRKFSESLATPQEKMQAEIVNMQRLWAAAAIDQETVRRGAAKIAHEYKSAGEEAKKLRELTKPNVAALEKGTTAEFTARQDAIFAVKQQAEAQKQQTAELKRIAALQQREIDETRRIVDAVLAIQQPVKGRF